MLPTEISGGVCFTSRYVGNSATRDQAVTGQACDFRVIHFLNCHVFFSASATLGSVQSWYYLKVTWCKKGGKERKKSHRDLDF